MNARIEVKVERGDPGGISCVKYDIFSQLKFKADARSVSKLMLRKLFAISLLTDETNIARADISNEPDCILIVQRNLRLNNRWKS
jgi:hypothetical protein